MEIASKILVTGGAGFIGSHLVDRLLVMGREVVVIDNLRERNKLSPEASKAVRFFEGDVRDPSVVRSAADGCGLVFHLAAMLGVDVVAEHPVETMETEVLGMKNVAEAALESGMEKIIYASTSGVYGKSAIESAAREDYNVSPKSSYSIAKRFNEIYLAALHQERHLCSASLRFFNVYGPRQDSRMVIPRFFDQALRGEPVTIFGSGEQTRDFTYIDDAVEAAIRISKLDLEYEIFNVSNEREYSVGCLAEEIVALTGSMSPVVKTNPSKDRYDFDVERRYGSSEKLHQWTGFKPSTPLDTGLRRIHDHLVGR